MIDTGSHDGCEATPSVNLLDGRRASEQNDFECCSH
jgi:hypothetical protein